MATMPLAPVRSPETTDADPPPDLRSLFVRPLGPAGGVRGAPPLRVRDLLPGLHGPAPDRALRPDRLAAPAPGEPDRDRRAQRDRDPRPLRGEHDDPARRGPDVRGRGVQRD